MQQPAVASKPFAILMLLALGLGMLGGCARFNNMFSGDSIMGVITPYRVEIVQGNVVTKEQIASTKVGMTRQQVRDVLGSPLLTDIFHADRWDYVFTIKRQGTPPQERRVVLRFDGDKLKSVEAPELPSEREFVASITRARDAAGPVPPLELTADQRKALPVHPPAPEAAASGASTGPQRSYPALDAKG